MKLKTLYLHIFSAVLIILSLSGCSRTANDHEILFVGIDALDWEIMNPLMDAGRLPNFNRLKRMGVSARINTNETGGSAVYWTSIATGQHADKHGIKGFVYNDPETDEITPYTSNTRKSKAFWNILNDKGISSGVIGWYISWPAEALNGFMISSYMGLKEKDQMTWKGTLYAGVSGMVYPQDLQSRVDEYIRTAEASYLTKLGNIVRPKELLTESPEILTTKGSFLTDEIYHAAALDLLKKNRPRVFAVYYSCLDVVGHQFTHPIPAVQKSLEEKYGKVQENYYLYLDRVLGHFLAELKRNTILVVVSDHGLRGNEHTDDGVFMATGPPIKQNTWTHEQINLTDIAPTMLYLLGLPVSLEMDGRVFTGAVKDEYLMGNSIQYVPSFGPRDNIDESPTKSQFDDQIIQRLKTLGYLK
ncbi:alkaline phosphatase family protein [Acidobacteriota bacterium]